MRTYPNRRAVMAGAGAFGMLAGRPAAAKTYGPGVTDSEIKLGTPRPTAGPPQPTASTATPRPPIFR